MTKGHSRDPIITPMGSSAMPPASGAPIRFGTLDFVFTTQEEPLVGATFPWPQRADYVGVSARTGQAPASAPADPTCAAEHVLTTLSAQLPRLLGPSPSQEHFRDVTFSTANIMLRIGEEPLSWSNFATSYAAMYPDEQPCLSVPR